MIDSICARHKAESIQAIGNVAVIYRRNVKSDRFGKIVSDKPLR